MENIQGKNNIERTLEYYFQKRNKIIDFVNENDNLTADQIIKCGRDMSELEYKITALEIAKEN